MPLNDVPLSTQTLGVTQPLIRGNFSTIDTAFSVDHVSYQAAGQGKHKQLSIPSGFAGQPFTYLAGEIGIQNLNQAPTNVNDLWLSRGVAAPYPMTGCKANLNGWTYLPSGILVKWGNITGSFPNGTWNTFTFPVAADTPVFGAVYSVMTQPVSTVSSPDTSQTFNYLTVAAVTALNFQWIPRTNFGNVNQMSVFYVAIGIGV